MQDLQTVRCRLVRLQWNVRGMAFESALKRSVTPLERRFNPDQPRAPAGSPDGGRWIADAVVSLLRDIPIIGDLLEGEEADIYNAQYRGELHDAVVEKLAADLRAAGNPTVTELPISVLSNPSLTARLDLLTKGPDGELVGMEIKTGTNPSYTPMQRVVYPHLVVGGLVTSPSSRASDVGLEAGKPFPPINLFTVYARAPGERLRIKPTMDDVMD